jgi:hypothetical protein
MMRVLLKPLPRCGDHLLSRELRPYGALYYNRYHGNAVKGIWALCENIYDSVITNLDFPIILDR